MANESISANDALGFFAFRSTSDHRGYIGAVLVTSISGVPLEFHCTHAVKPTAVQKALYGKRLESYVSLTLCGKPLLEKLTNTPTVCLVEREEMVNLRELVYLPILYPQHSGDVLQEANHPLLGKAEHISGNLGGLRATTFHSHQRWSEDFEQARPALELASRHIDFLEPFERITNSLSILEARDENFR